MGVVKRIIRLLARMGCMAVILLQPAYGEPLKDSGWLSVAETIQQFQDRGDYKSAFYALDRYVSKRGELFYQNSFLTPAPQPWFFYKRQKAGRTRIELSALCNTISSDTQEFGRTDPIVGYDYAALGEAYRAIKDSQQSDAYYLEATKILMAAL